MGRAHFKSDAMLIGGRREVKALRCLDLDTLRQHPGQVARGTLVGELFEGELPGESLGGASNDQRTFLAPLRLHLVMEVTSKKDRSR